MRYIIVAGLAAVVGAAAMGHLLERRTSLTCRCDPDCWCRRRGAGALRWMVPAGHRCSPEPPAREPVSD